MKHSWILLVAFLFMFACGGTGNPGTDSVKAIQSLKQPDTVKKVEIVELKVDEPLSYLKDIEIIKDYILVISPRSTDMVKIIDPETGKIVKSFAKKGQAPGEFIGFPSIIKDPVDENSFWLYDLTTSKLKKYNLNDVLNGNFTPVKIISGLTFFFHLALLPQGSVAGVGYFSDARIKIKKENGKIFNIGEVPVKAERFKKQHSQGYDSNVVFIPENNTILLATIWGGLIEKYDLSGRFKGVFMLPDGFFPEYRIVEGADGAHWTFSKKSRRGIFDVKYCKFNNLVYLLFSGQKVIPGKNSP